MPPAPEAHRFLLTLDVLPIELAFLDLRETLVPANRALIRVLNEVPDAERLHQEIRHFVRSLTTLICVHRPILWGEVQELAARKLSTERARYQLRGSFVGFDLFGSGSTLLIVLEHLPPDLPGVADMRERFGLSPKECEITLLLAEGMANTDIAKSLCISPHTAHTHTKRILEKLAVCSRAEIRPKLQHS